MHTVDLQQDSCAINVVVTLPTSQEPLRFTFHPAYSDYSVDGYNVYTPAWDPDPLTSATLSAPDDGTLLSQDTRDDRGCTHPNPAISRFPQVAQHLFDAVYNVGQSAGMPGQTNVLNYDSSPTKRANTAARRAASTAACHAAGAAFRSAPGTSAPSQCDEYPFGSTLEGGLGADVLRVNAQDNMAQGRDLKAFYTFVLGPSDGDTFVVIPDL